MNWLELKMSILFLFVSFLAFASALAEPLPLPRGTWKETAKDIQVTKLWYRENRFLLKARLQDEEKKWSWFRAQVEFRPGDEFINLNGVFQPTPTLNIFDVLLLLVPPFSIMLGNHLKTRLLETKEELKQVKAELNQKEKELRLLRKKCKIDDDTSKPRFASKKWWFFWLQKLCGSYDALGTL
ncbi:MAG: hypothetical protein SGARI_003380 [Bacillariaceae sp.]